MLSCGHILKFSRILSVIISQTSVLEANHVARAETEQTSRCQAQPHECMGIHEEAEVCALDTGSYILLAYYMYTFKRMKFPPYSQYRAPRDGAKDCRLMWTNAIPYERVR